MTKSSENHAEGNARAHYETMVAQLLAIDVLRAIDGDRLLPDVFEDQIVMAPDDNDDDLLIPETVSAHGVDVTIDKDGHRTVSVEGEEVDDYDSLTQSIYKVPLSVQVRSDWVAPGTDDFEASEYEILLSTGGPALRIVGMLSAYGEPISARMEWQDWGTPWTFYAGPDQDILLEWASHFHFTG